MKSLFVLSLIVSLGAQAFQCDDDAQCLSKSLRLIRKAAKKHLCTTEMNALASVIRNGNVEENNAQALSLEKCLPATGVTKLSRLEKALASASKTKGVK